MRLKIYENGIQLWLSKQDTYNFAQGYIRGEFKGKWPCSTLANKSIYAEFDSHGLCDLLINGRYLNQNQDIDGHEFNALVSSYLENKLDSDHICHFMVVGQFV